MSHTFGIMSTYFEMNLYNVFFVLVWCICASGHKEVD